MRHIEDARLHNLIQASPRIFSGGAPEGPEAFAALAELGVRTIVSVDGSRPDLAAAAAQNLRYVHIPFGYDGVQEAAALQIASVLAETTGRIYFHCHHGRHRGPAAAAIALRVETSCAGPEALELMRLAETDPKYEGLWRDVSAFIPPAPGTPLPALHQVAEVGDFTSGMAHLDRVWDRIKQLQSESWRTPTDHPDLVPAIEARILAETFASLGRAVPEHLHADADFLRRLTAVQDDATALHAALAATDSVAADSRFQSLKRSCTACHDRHRN
jgi:hypothetical protein